MSKHILFCADGTWNGPADNPTTTDIDGTIQKDIELDQDVTNVVKFFAHLGGQVTPQTQALHNETEKELRDPAGNLLQVAKYMHGVGDSQNAVMKVIGGVFGAGVIARIIRGYTYISRHYKPGDSIHILGFSRGAYTARALAGMIASVGLLNPKTYNVNDKTNAYLRGLAAWLKCKGIVFEGNSKLSTLLTAVTAFAGEAIATIALRRDDLIPNVRVASVGVWDTVGAMGIPNYIKGDRRDFFSFVNRRLSPLVEHAFHAMALDERRLDFPVTRWEQDPRIEEMWFAGAHSDVGGGYVAGETGLSDIALDWMMGKLGGLGVQFAKPAPRIDVNRFTDEVHTPWKRPPFNIEPRAREPQKNDAFHPTLIERWNALPAYQKLWPSGFGS